MSGFLTNGMNELAVATGLERFPVDTQLPSGENPETASLSLFKLATMLNKLSSNLDLTTVAGTMYYRQWTVEQTVQWNGIEVLIGSVGGTDKWLVGVWNAAGVLVAESDTTGVNVSATANTWQQFPFKPGGAGVATPQVFNPGTYYIGFQSNGTTAKARAYNGPLAFTFPVGTKAGAFGTLASLAPVSTTFTAGQGPVCEPY